MSTANQTVQRTGAGRIAQGGSKRNRRLATVADLFRCVIGAFLKSTFTLMALSLLLTACSKDTSDASIYRRVIGVWSSDAQPGKVIENRSDGMIVVKLYGVEIARGQWQVTNGYIIEGVGSSTMESNKILSVSTDQMVILSTDGHTRLTFKKQ